MKKSTILMVNKMTFLILLVILSVSHLSYSQEISFEWESLISVPEDGKIIINSTVVHNNHLYFTGSYSGEEISFGDLALANTGNNDYILGCLSLDGKPKWIQTAVSSGNERGYKIIVNDKNEIVVFGFYNGQNLVFNDEHHIGNFDSSKSRTTLYSRDFTFSAIYSIDGKLLNASSKNIYLFDDQLSIAEHKDNYGNSYYIRSLGSKDRPKIGNGIAYRTNGGNDFLIFKRNINGKIVWVKQFGGVNDDKAILNVTKNHLTIAVTYKSHFIPLSNNTQLTNSNPGYESVGIIRLSLEGELLWALDLPFESKSIVKKFIVDENGDVFIVGNTGTIPDGFIAKVSTSGQLVWQSKFGGVGYDYISSIDKSESEVLVLGAFKSRIWNHGFISPNGTSSPRPRGGRDLFLASVDLNDGATKKFIQLGGSMKSGGNFVSSADGLILCRTGQPGVYFEKIQYSSIRQLPDGYSFMRLQFKDHVRTGELKVQPDYSYINHSSEPTMNKIKLAPINKPSSKQPNQSKTKSTNVLDGAEKEINKAKKKLKGLGSKLKNLGKGN